MNIEIRRVKREREKIDDITHVCRGTTNRAIIRCSGEIYTVKWTLYLDRPRKHRSIPDYRVLSGRCVSLSLFSPFLIYNLINLNGKSSEILCNEERMR